jgi:hypothetical protein
MPGQRGRPARKRIRLSRKIILFLPEYSTINSVKAKYFKHKQKLPSSMASRFFIHKELRKTQRHEDTKTQKVFVTATTNNIPVRHLLSFLIEHRKKTNDKVIQTLPTFIGDV